MEMSLISLMLCKLFCFSAWLRKCPGCDSKANIKCLKCNSCGKYCILVNYSAGYYMAMTVLVICNAILFICSNGELYVALWSSMSLALLVWVGRDLKKRVLQFLVRILVQYNFCAPVVFFSHKCTNSFLCTCSGVYSPSILLCFQYLFNSGKLMNVF